MYSGAVIFASGVTEFLLVVPLELKLVKLSSRDLRFAALHNLQKTLVTCCPLANLLGQQNS